MKGQQYSVCTSGYNKHTREYIHQSTEHSLTDRYGKGNVKGIHEKSPAYKRSSISLKEAAYFAVARKSFTLSLCTIPSLKV